MAKALPHSIKVGLCCSLSGQFRVQGAQVFMGIGAWVEDANAAGGVLVASQGEKLPLRLVYYDDQSSVQRVRELTRSLVKDDSVDLLMGPYSSALTRAAAEQAEKLGRVLWNHGGSADSIYQQRLRWIVGVLSSASSYLAAAPDLVREADPGASRVAIIHSQRGSFSNSVAQGAAAQARELGMEVVYHGTFASPASDFSSLLQEVAATRPHLLVGVGRIEDDLLLAQQIDRALAPANALVATPIHQFRERLGDRAEGFLGPSQWEPVDSGVPVYGPTLQQVVPRLAELNHGVVDYPMAQAYAAGLVAQRCIESAGTVDNEALRRTANDLDFPTFYGRFKIDPATGCQVGHQVVLVQWQAGKKVVVWPPAQRQGDFQYPMRSS